MVQEYTLVIGDDQLALTMPEASRLLHLGQRLDGPTDELQLWAEVDTDEPPEVRTFRIYGTGQPMPEDQPLHHVGTMLVWIGLAQTEVWHVYELRSPEHFQRREVVVGEVGNEPGWIGEAHIAPPSWPRPWRHRPIGEAHGPGEDGSGLLPVWNQ